MVLTIKADCVLCEVKNVAEETLKDPSTTIEHDFCGRFSLRYRDINVLSI